jgi:hypothetical protein
LFFTYAEITISFPPIDAPLGKVITVDIEPPPALDTFPDFVP